MSEKREHLRTSLKAEVKICMNDDCEMMMTMRDVSNSGIFVFTSGNEAPPIGTVLSIQLQGMLADAPVISAKVVRIDKEGFGLQFLDSA